MTTRPRGGGPPGPGRDVETLAGHAFNINSSAQLGKVLFNLGVPWMMIGMVTLLQRETPGPLQVVALPPRTNRCIATSKLSKTSASFHAVGYLC